MPLRRRPPEPSPRVRALLEAAGRERAGSPDLLGRQGSVAKAGSMRSTGRRAQPGLIEPPGQSRGWVPPAPEAVVGAVPTKAAGRHRRRQPSGSPFLVLPQSLQGARVGTPRAAIVGLLLVVGLAMLCFGVRIAWARAASQPHVVAPGRSGSAVTARGTASLQAPGGTGSSGFASSPTGSGGGGPPTTPTGVVIVQVVGQVSRPGVLRLPAGSRVADAVAAAGGMRRSADPSGINLARVLADGEQVRVPKVGEVSPPAPGQTDAGAGGGAGAVGASPGAPLNLNTASASELDSLPGVGPVLAQRIVDWRTEHGRFASVDELGEVSGIGEKIFAELRPKVTV